MGGVLGFIFIVGEDGRRLPVKMQIGRVLDLNSEFIPIPLPDKAFVGPFQLLLIN